MRSVTPGGAAGAALFAAAVLLLAFAPSASPHFQSYPFSLSSCPASYSAQADPISTVFYGSYTGYGYALNAVQYHLGWRDTGGSTQYFSSHDYCAQMRGQRASDCSFGCSRFHLRVRNTYHSDPTWGSTTVATPHHEDWVWYCNYGVGGHAVDKGGVKQGIYSGFMWGADTVFNGLYGTDHVYGGWSYWANTREIKQCDGDYAGGSGYQDWFSLHGYLH